MRRLAKYGMLLLVLGLLAAIGCSQENSQSAVVSSNSTSDVGSASPAVAKAVVASATNPKPKLKPGAKTRVLDRAGDKPYDKTFDDVRFDIQPGQPFHRKMLPQPIEQLSGQKIRIRGYMLPTAQRRGIKEFVLVRDNQECCFGPGAALYDCMLVELIGGKAIEYSFRPVTVEGNFAINEIVIDGKHLAIYRVDADEVK